MLNTFHNSLLTLFFYSGEIRFSSIGSFFLCLLFGLLLGESGFITFQVGVQLPYCFEFIGQGLPLIFEILQTIVELVFFVLGFSEYFLELANLVRKLSDRILKLPLLVQVDYDQYYPGSRVYLSR